MAFQMFFDEGVTADVLLIHTIGAGLEIAVAIILVRVLYLLRRNGESSREFASIAIMMLLASLARVGRLSLAWASRGPLFWVDAITITLLFIIVIYIPVALSARYFGVEEAEQTKRSRAKWVHREMIGNSVCVIIDFLIEPRPAGFRLITPAQLFERLANR